MRTTYRTPRQSTRARRGGSTVRAQLIRHHEVLKTTAPAMRSVH